MKICRVCKLEKDPVVDFYPRHGRCKPCYSQSRVAYTEANKKSRRVQIDEWAEKNPDAIKAKKERFYNKNRNYNKNYYQVNKDRMKALSKAYIKEREATDPSYKIGRYLRKRLNSILKNKKHSLSPVKNLGCSLEELKKYLESHFKLGMTWDNHGQGPGKWQLDHIKALVLFDLTNELQYEEACHFTNLQPLWHEDHATKTAKDIELWRLKLA